jgi:hypothetical protein
MFTLNNIKNYLEALLLHHFHIAEKSEKLLIELYYNLENKSMLL